MPPRRSVDSWHSDGSGHARAGAVAKGRPRALDGGPAQDSVERRCSGCPHAAADGGRPSRGTPMTAWADRAYGRTGLVVSPLGLGTGMLGDARVSERDAESLLRGAIEL